MTRRAIITGISGLTFFATGMLGGLAMRPSTKESSPEADRVRVDPQSPEAAAPLVAAHDRFQDAVTEDNLYERQLSLVEILAKADLSECRRLLERCDRSDQMAIRNIAARWAEIDPNDLYGYLLGDGKKFQTNPWVIGELFAAWTKDDADSAFHAISNLPPKLRDFYAREIIGYTLYMDLEKALGFVEELNSVGLGLNWQFSDWPDSDRERAAQLLLSLPRGNFKQKASAMLAERWGRDDPAAALVFAEQLQEDVFREFAIESVVSGMIRRNHGAAKEAVEKTTGASRARLGRQLARQIGETDPQAAVEWVSANLEGGARATAIFDVIQHTARMHPAQIAKIAEHLPTGYRKENAIKIAARAWALTDRTAAEAWAAGLEADFARTAALEALK